MSKKIFPNYQAIKNLSLSELTTYSNKIRNTIIEITTKNSGHFSSSLGCVEIIMAMHYVFDAENDNFIFDIGHQSCAHKILTNRIDEVSKYHFDAVSVFLDYHNKFDKYDAGHSSTSIAIATGMRIADALNKKTNHSISLIGDASFNGLAFASWNNVLWSTNNIVIINDNNMSITKTVGILHHLLQQLKITNNSILNADFLIKNKGYYEFDDFILYSNVDGHDLKTLITVLSAAKLVNKPVIIHAITIKGKGYPLAEIDQTGEFHYFDQTKKLTISHLDKQLIALAKQYHNWVIFNPSTIKGSGIVDLFNKFPQRCIDVGINEDVALLMACGSALKKTPAFVAIYASFFQRAYDQLNHDINRFDVNVNILLNKSGLHPIGETHHGIYDINLCRNLDNVTIVEANNLNLQKQLLEWALLHPGPVIIRTIENLKYLALKNDHVAKISLGSWSYPTITNNDKIKNVIISYGSLYNLASNYSNELLDTITVNAIFIKPLDEKLLLSIKDLNIIILEEQLINSGLGSLINEFYFNHNIKINLSIIGLTQENLKAAFGKNLYQKAQFEKNDIINKLNKLTNRKF